MSKNLILMTGASSTIAQEVIQKFQNNKLMDGLVDDLGYLDYRDMLAANRYILEAK